MNALALNYIVFVCTIYNHTILGILYRVVQLLYDVMVGIVRGCEDIWSVCRQLVEAHGSDAQIHLLCCLFSHVVGIV